MYLIIGLVIVIVVYFIYKKTTSLDSKKYVVADNKAKEVILRFFDEIMLDYRNEYLMNYLAVRYNIKEFESETSYVFKTKRIGSLANLLDFDQMSFGDEYLADFIVSKYKIIIPVDNQLQFMTDISRIEGKIEAVDSVKHLLPEKDYNRLISELKDDIVYYKSKYSTNL